MSKGSILRLARRGGVKRFGGEAYPETRAALSDYLKDVLSDSVSYAEHEKRRTVSALDVVHALQRSGINMYGFGC
ncbi:histone-fold-containing protein [Agrocybe pediades]|nr:histone-fold-containing protein [Agrocybe pediades]